VMGTATAAKRATSPKRRRPVSECAVLAGACVVSSE
jgi:hypothetical protein